MWKNKDDDDDDVNIRFKNNDSNIKNCYVFMHSIRTITGNSFWWSFRSDYQNKIVWELKYFPILINFRVNKIEESSL